ncbi:MAG: primosomal protein N' [Clostridiales bacterium 38-18]|nr:MAG: primosomal protein N' [Clostridiales bacterium 38-18]
MYAQIIILKTTSQLDRPFTYRVPDLFQNRVFVGARVLVPFGRSGYLEGIVVEILEEIETVEYEIKSIHYVFSDGVHLDGALIDCARFIAQDTVSTVSEALQLFLPSGTQVNQKKIYTYRSDFDVTTHKLKKVENCLINQLSDFELNEEALLPAVAAATKRNAINRLLAIGAIDLRYEFEQSVVDAKEDWIIATDYLKPYLENIPSNHIARQKLAQYMLKFKEAKRLEVQTLLKVPKSIIDRFCEEGALILEERNILRLPEFMTISESKRDITLNPEQQMAYDEIVSTYRAHKSNDFLLYGVTGSGKTEVYAELIETIINEGKKAIVVVPEITLTSQLVGRLASRFGAERIALLHSKLSPGERYDQWKGIKQGAYDIVIGARSAIFAPLEMIGIIIIDECHEPAFRSEKRPKYATYDISKYRAKASNAILICGSATPTVGSYKEAIEGKRHLIRLNSRHNQKSVPEIEIIDMRQELKEGNKSILSRTLYEAMLETLDKKQQIIIFLNRKGHSTFVSCRSCGFTLACPNCDVTLTYFKGERSVKCNYCNYETYVPKKCPKCESQYFKYFGVGTEKVEEQLSELFPKAKIARMDRTTTTKKGSAEQIISDVEAEAVDILIGTQMVAKGLDFKNVTLIGILSADLMLNLPNFQASERAYQLFNQVAGRAGRGAHEGRVILQTYSPDHYALNQVSYESFYLSEINYREQMKYPPFYNLVNLLFSSGQSQTASEYAERSHLYLKKKILKKGLQNNIELYPANPALLKKIDNTYRWQVIIKVKPEALSEIKEILKDLETHFYDVKTCKLSMDLDATHIL